MAGERFGTRVGNILTAVGAIVAVFGVIAMVTRLKITLTPEMQELLFYKGLFAAAAGLLIAGALIGRRGRAAAKDAAARQTEVEALRRPAEMPLTSTERRAAHDQRAQS